MPRAPSRVPSPWFVLLPGLLLALVGARAVVGEMRADEERARDRARSAAENVARSVDVLVGEFRQGLPEEGATLTAEAALESARHLFPRRLITPEGNAVRAADAAGPSDAERAFVRDAFDAAARLGDDEAGVEAAESLLAAAALAAPGDRAREMLRVPWVDAEDDDGGELTLDVDLPRLVWDEDEWGEAVVAHALRRAARLAPDAIVPREIASMLRTRDTLRAAAASASADGRAEPWIATDGRELAIGVVSPRFRLDGSPPRDAHVAGDVPSAVVSERIVLPLEDAGWKGPLTIRVLAPDGTMVAGWHPTQPHVDPLVETVSLAPPFAAWRVEAVASREGGVPATAWILGIAVVATTAALVASVFALRRAADEQARLAADRQSFLDHVAHEVRTPAGALLALGEELASGRVPAERQPAYHAHLANEARRLARLVEDTLDLSRLDAGKLDLRREPVDLRAVVAEGIAAASAEDRVTFRAPTEPVVVRADGPALRRVVRNLVDNALRHGAAASPPEVLVEPNGREVRVVVRDSGRGLPPEHLARVFERFWRDPSRTHETKGTGVGLAICREIARAHGGDVDAASAPGRGATFTLRLPLGGDAPV